MTISAAQRQRAEHLLRSMDRVSLARGRAYAAEGRVFAVRVEGPLVTARVRGTETYQVKVRLDEQLYGACSCPAADRVGGCKHVAALLASLGVAKAGPDELPSLLWSIFSSAEFLERLALYTGELPDVSEARWLPLRDWWYRTQSQPTERSRKLKQQILVHASDIEADLEAIRAWDPPPAPRGQTAFASLQRSLVARYKQQRARAKLRSVPPGPLEPGKHPGFDLRFDPKTRVFEAKERLRFRGASTQPRLWNLRVPLVPTDGPEVEGDGSLDAPDAWDLFVLRAVILALGQGAESTEDAVRALVRELDRPLWDHVLEEVSAPDPEPRADVRLERAFGLYEKREAYETQPSWGLVPFERTIRETKSGEKITKWRRTSFDAIFTADHDGLEADIARLAHVSLDKPHDAHVTLGRPHAHDLLALLARHPRVHISDEGKPDPDTNPLADIHVGEMTMRLERGKGGLVPSFLVGGVDVGYLVSWSIGEDSFEGRIDGTRIVSAFVPPPLRKWVRVVRRLGEGLVFPTESIPRLQAATQTLVEKGHVELPREALGEELRFDPSPALRVEWHKDGRGARLEVLIAVHPGAPLVSAGAGPTLFAFELAGRRVFVDRQKDLEHGVVESIVGAMDDAPVRFVGNVAVVDELEQTIDLAKWLAHNPLNLPIEVKVGRAPSVSVWGAALKQLVVHEEGAWLRLDGALDVQGTKLTIGDVLEAVRLAHKYVRVGSDLFLELSEEAQKELRDLALAVELAGKTKGETSPKINRAFANVLLKAAPMLGRERDAQLEALADKLRGGAGAVKVPPLEHGELRHYQHEGAEWILRLAAWAPGCVLADDMGLGKTIQTASVLRARSKIGPALVVAPASVTSNWVAELARFMPKALRVRWFNEERDLDLGKLGPRDVVVVSYNLLQRPASAPFGEVEWATVVLDEAQYVKNIAAQRTEMVRRLKREFTIALTGTPLENHLGELYSIVDLAFPGLLGDPHTFVERFRRPIEAGRDPERLAVLGRLVAPFLLRRTRKAVLEELPPREDITEFVELRPEEQKRYLALRKACEEIFSKKGKERRMLPQLRIELLAALTRLRQLACDVRLVDPAFEGDGTKIVRATELVKQIAEEGNKVLVFSQFTQFLEKARFAFEAAGLRVGYLSGETPTTKRRAIIDEFQSGDLDVFCVSLLAGGTGLNLTRASYVVHLDPWWNPAAEEQATSRAHRMGQTEPVTVYRLVARGTIEEAVLDMQEHKRELATAILEGKGEARALEADELLDLLRFGT